MRLFLAALVHETNTFSPLPTTVASFEELVLHRPGQAATLDRARRSAGYAECWTGARARGHEVVEGLCAYAQPSGPLSRRDYEALRDELLAGLEAAGPLDAVVLVLHGAMVADGVWDCEGDLLTRVRRLVGPAMPVGALLDLHGNLSPDMLGSGAALIACKEYPHTDYADRAGELLGLLERQQRSGQPHGAVMHRAGLLGIFGTTAGPMQDYVARLKAAEQQPGILSVSAFHGFPWSDTPHTSAALLVLHEGGDAATARRAQACAAELAAAFYELRETASPPRLAPAAALDAAVAQLGSGRPVVIADGADNPGGGAACDSTFLLRAVLDRGLRGVALGMLWDPQAVAFAAAAGVGARLALRIGGKVGPLSGDPVDVVAEVLAVRDDAQQTGLGGLKDDLGRAVALRVAGSSNEDGVDLVLNTLRQQVFAPDCFTSLGIAVAAKQLVIVKSTQHFRAGFDPMAAAILYCDAPGSLNGDLAALPYRHLQRPVWPLDR